MGIDPSLIEKLRKKQPAETKPMESKQPRAEPRQRAEPRPRVDSNKKIDDLKKELDEIRSMINVDAIVQKVLSSMQHQPASIDNMNFIDVIKHFIDNIDTKYGNDLHYLRRVLHVKSQTIDTLPRATRDLLLENRNDFARDINVVKFWFCVFKDAMACKK